MASEYRLISKDAKIDEKYIRHYTHVYQVIVDDFNISAAAAAAIVPIAIFDPHPVDGYAYVRSKNAKPLQGQLGFWEVTLEYDSTPQEPGQQESNNQNEEPTARPPTLTFDSEATTKPLIKDLAGDPVVNSSGMLYDPPLSIQVYYPTINVSFFSATMNPEDVAYYTNKANSNAFSIGGYSWPARTLLVTKYAATSQYEQGAIFWQKTISLKVAIQDEEGEFIEWDKIKGLDCGTHRLVTGKPPQPILDKTGNAITTPIPLQNGQPLNSGDTPVYLEYKGYAEVSFVSLFS
jgi:hypothetical protein